MTLDDLERPFRTLYIANQENLNENRPVLVAEKI